MWIHYIGEIMIGVVVLLVLAHLGLHAYFKYQKRKKRASSKKAEDA